MSKFQKIAFYSFLVLALLGGAWAYKAFKNQQNPSLKAIDAIPDSCLFLLKFDAFSEANNMLQNNSLVWQDIHQIEYLKPVQTTLHFFDSLLQAHPELYDLVNGQSVYATIYPERTWLICFNLDQLSSSEKLKEWFPETLQLNGNFIFSKSEAGLVSLSNSRPLLEKFYSPTQSKLSKNSSFRSFYENHHYKGLVLYCAGTGENHLLSNSYAQIHSTPQTFLANGFIQPDSNSLLKHLGEGIELDDAFFNRLPLVCRQFEAFHFSNMEKTIVTNGRNWWTDVNDSALFNARQQFYNSLQQTLIKAELPSRHNAVILPLKDSALLKELMPYLYDSIIPRVFPIYQLNKKKYSFSNSTFSGLNCEALHYACLINNAIIFTYSIDDADIFINAYINKSSLLLNPGFKAFAEEQLQDKTAYVRYGIIHQQDKHHIPFGTALQSKDLDHLKNINHFAYTATPNSAGLRFRMLLNYYQENSTDEPALLWSFKADTSIITSPGLFKNHNTKDNEIAFQTANRTLYLISSTGRLIWKKQLNETVRSSFYIVDAFKKNKFQLLFNTDNYIHLIDRNGNYVQGYPVKLPAKATSALSVINYENKTDERIFIACANATIYNYSLWGIKQEGFKPFKTENTVTLPIRYCRVGASDYLITADVKGKIYAFSRKGEGRIDFKNKLIEQTETLEIVEGNRLQNTYLMYPDPSNNLIHKISLNDKKEVFKTGTDSDSLHYTFYDEDLNGIPEVIANKTGSINVYDFNGSLQDHFNTGNTFLPDYVRIFRKEENLIYLFGQSSSFGVTIYEKQKNKNQKFESNTPPLISDLFKNGKLFILTTSHGKLKCYGLHP
ncbi:MAG: hypothetical protein QM534_04130 [Sediminibacterium sp.]|nr:hypothetical protein [Sediminibacterium sp.]